MQYDYLIVGGGIVGLSCAWQLQKRYPHASILLLEKEKEIEKKVAKPLPPAPVETVVVLAESKEQVK